ncbi:hypothetical protein AOZ07_03805 [Glutamicibacter halophytocola]|nr:hypothetical protein AOZ07_03805 [Glutamicibacter halophytocola]
MEVVHDLPEAAETLLSLPAELDRVIIRKTVLDNLQSGRALAAFVPVVIWGGPGGYEPFRA